MRKLTAIIFADTAGFTRDAAEKETREKPQLQQIHRVINSLVDQHKGERLKKIGTGQLSCFDNVVDAVNCAIAIQQKMSEYPDAALRIGIHIGELLYRDGDVTGDGINITSRIQGMAATGGICISERVYRSKRFRDKLKGRPDLEVQPVGDVSLKNVAKPQSVYAILAEGVSLPDELSDSKSKVYGIKSHSLLGIGVVLLLLLGAGFWWYYGAETDLEDKPSVAVLPFEDFSEKGDQQWLAHGLTEEILNSLVRLEGLFVPARTSSFAFKDKSISIRKIAESLGVNHVVEGSVRRFNGRMRIAVQLIRAEDGGHLWSKVYNRSTDSVFAVQKDIARNIAKALDVYLNKEQRERMFAFGTRDVRAYEALLKGDEIYYKAHQAGDISELWDANKWYNKAIRLDSTFAFAYQQRTDSYYHFLLGQVSSEVDTLSRKEAYDRIIADFNRSIRYSNNSGTRLLYRFNKSFLTGDWEPIPELARKINDNPDAFQSFVLTGGGALPTGFIGAGYASLARELYREKLKHDPLNGVFKYYDVLALISLGKPKVALEEYQDYLGKTPVFKAGVHIHAGQVEKARQLLRNLDSSEDGFNALALKILLGMEKVGRQDLKSYAADYNDLVEVILYASAGYPDKADSVAHVIDKSSLIPCKKLAPVAGNIINFSLEATPNLARCFEQANIETKPYTFGGIEVRRIVQKEL